MKSDFFQKMNKYWNNHPLIASMIVFVFIFISFVSLYSFSSGDPMVDDHYFHFKYAHLIRTEGLDVANNFDHIYLTGVAQNGGTYPISLFQISLIPFTYFSDGVFAIQIVDAFYASLAFAVIYYTLRKTKVKYALFFTLTLFVSAYFLLRILLGRAFVLIIALVFFEMYLAVQKKYKTLFFVSMFHVFWHQNTYFMPLVITGVVEISRYLVYQKIFLKNIFSVILAIIVAMAFFPGFPNSIIGGLNNIFTIQSDASLNENVKTIGGGELISKDFMTSFVSEKVFLFLFLICTSVVLFLYVQQKKRNEKLFVHIDEKYILWIYSLFIFMIGMMLGTITISGRFTDFLIPSIFFLTAFIVTALSRCEKINIETTLQRFLMTSVVVFVFILSVNTYIEIYGLANKFDYEPAQKVANWISDESVGRERVFLHNWSEFTIMFFENHKNVYSMGIEPMALKSYDEALYWKYYNIFNYNYYCEKLGDCKRKRDDEIKYLSNVSEDAESEIKKRNSKKIIESIKNDFDSRFIVSSSNVFSAMIELNKDMIEDRFYVKSDKYKGHSMEFTVFKLK